MKNGCVTTLCSLVEDHMLRYNDDQPDVKGGMHFNLHNNLWGTAFLMRYLGLVGVARVLETKLAAE